MISSFEWKEKYHSRPENGMGVGFGWALSSVVLFNLHPNFDEEATEKMTCKFCFQVKFVIDVCGKSLSDCTALSFVDGHLRLRTPYPVRSVKLSSLKLG